MSDLEIDITAALRQYSTEVEEDLEKAQKEVGQKAVAELKGAGSFKDRTGKYRKGWRLKKDGNHYVVHNATDYQLTHLLENGHASRNGGRTEAFVHIKPVDDMVATEFEEIVKKRLS
jgi:hypothetical protein